MDRNEYVTRVAQYLIQCGYEHRLDVNEAGEDLWRIVGKDPATPEEAAYQFTIGFDGGLES